MEHRPRKRFGQNFLQNPHIIDRILETFNPQPDDNVVEIGPGLGALTHPLLHTLHQLTVIEIDRDLLQPLSKLPKAELKLNVIAMDALRVTYDQFGKRLRIIGNLPYNISTPLLIHLLSYVDYIDDMHFMFQKEVGVRLSALPGCKHYGRLSILVQYFCETDTIIEVPPNSFFPQPKVDSVVVRLIPYKHSPYEAVSLSQLEHLLAYAFSMRRKTIANNLKPLLTGTQLEKAGIDPRRRPEQLSIAEYVRIAKLINK